MKKIAAVLAVIALVFSFASAANAQLTKDRYYARSTLSGNELEFYDTVYSGIEQMQERLDVSAYGISKDRVNYLINILYYDAPELFYTNAYYEWRYNSNGNITVMYLRYDYSKDEVLAINKELKEKSAEILSYIDDDMTGIEKFEAVYAYLGEHIEYDYAVEKKREDPSENKDAADAQKIIGGLINGKAVCAGMSASLQYILYQLDIPCYCATGNDHMWNIVKLDNNWYFTDLSKYTEIKAKMQYNRILMNENYYEWYNVEPDEYCPALPTVFSSYQWDYGDPTIYERTTSEPAAAATSTPTPEPTAAAASAELTATPEMTQGPEAVEQPDGEQVTVWYILGGAVITAIAAVMIVLAVKKKMRQ